MSKILRSSQAPCAVLIPVRSTIGDYARLCRLCASISLYEPLALCIIVLDHVHPEARQSLHAAIAAQGNIVILSNPRRGRGLGSLGGLFTGIAFGIDWIEGNLDVPFVIKVDVDTLIVGPFINRIASCLELAEGTGLFGVIGRTSNKADPSYGLEVNIISPLYQLFLNWCSLPKQLPESNFRETAKTSTFNRYERLVKIIGQAVENGYGTLNYCQGGGYVITRPLLNFLSRSFADHANPLDWLSVPVGEDVIIGMYAFASGCRITDSAQYDDIFALSWRGLPYSPEDIRLKGCPIVHSILNDCDFTESEILAHFQQRNSAFLGEA